MYPRLSPDYRWKDILDPFLPASKDYFEKFKQEFRTRTGLPHVHFFKYGRSGLYFLLKAMGAKNKKVIVPAYTCVVVPHAIVESGNIPVFLDCSPNSFQPNPVDYLKAIDADTVMIIPTHLFGIAEETSELYAEVKRQYPNIFVLQDCAHSFFCKDSTHKCVTEYGDGALFGMNISKLVNSVKGGALCIRNPDLSQKIDEAFFIEKKDSFFVGIKNQIFCRVYYFLAFFAFMPFLYSLVYWLQKNTKLLSAETDYYLEDSVELPKDFNEPMTSFQAKVGYKSILRYDKRVQNRRQVVYFYIKKLKIFSSDAELPEYRDGNTWSHFPIFFFNLQRENFMKDFSKKTGLELGKLEDYSCPDLTSYKQKSYRGCYRALSISKNIVNLPLTLGENGGLADITMLANKVVKFIEDYRQCDER